MKRNTHYVFSGDFEAVGDNLEARTEVVTEKNEPIRKSNRNINAVEHR